MVKSKGKHLILGLSSLLAVFIVAVALVGCGGNAEAPAEQQTEDTTLQTQQSDQQGQQTTEEDRAAKAKDFNSVSDSPYGYPNQEIAAKTDITLNGIERMPDNDTASNDYKVTLTLKNGSDKTIAAVHPYYELTMRETNQYGEQVEKVLPASAGDNVNNYGIYGEGGFSYGAASTFGSQSPEYLAEFLYNIEPGEVLTYWFYIDISPEDSELCDVRCTEKYCYEQDEYISWSTNMDTGMYEPQKRVILPPEITGEMHFGDDEGYLSGIGSITNDTDWYLSSPAAIFLVTESTGEKYYAIFNVDPTAPHKTTSFQKYRIDTKDMPNASTIFPSDPSQIQYIATVSYTQDSAN